MKQIKNREQLIKDWIYGAAAEIKASFDKELIIQEKTSRKDLVTNMDKAIEEMFIQKINEHFPEERILGEEGLGDDLNDLEGIVWIIDPIDGTLNFVKQQSDFAIMVAVYEDGKGQMGYIYDVMQDKMYSAIKNEGAFCNDQKLPTVIDVPLKEGFIAISSTLMSAEKDSARMIGKASCGVRLIGSAGIETVRVASGRLIGYLAASLAPWDIAAGKVIAEEVGLIYTQNNGEDINFLEKNAAVVATPKAHKEIIEMIQGQQTLKEK